MSTTRKSVDRATAATSRALPSPGTNVVVLRGTLSRDPEPRQLPSGDAVVTYDVTVRPAPGPGTSRAESVPVAWFDPRAGGPLAAGSAREVQGGGHAALGAPPRESERDWIALVKLAGPPPKAVPPPPDAVP